MEIFGGCLCGATRYRSSAPPIMTRVCWCRVCQYFAAGNGTVNVVFTRTAVTIEGSLRDYRSVADSGNVMHRRFSRAPTWAFIDTELPSAPGQPPPA